MRSFKSLSEKEVLALAIALEEEDARIYDDFAEGVQADYPATATILKEMRAEEDGHRHRLLTLYRQKFGEHIPLIRRQDVKASCSAGRCGWCGRWAWTRSASRSKRWNSRPSAFTRKRFSRPPTQAFASFWATWPKRSASTPSWPKIWRVHAARPARTTTRRPRAKRLFVLQVVQPGLAGLMDGSVSTLAPLFAAAFATHKNWETFLVGLAASVGPASAWFRRGSVGRRQPDGPGQAVGPRRGLRPDDRPGRPGAHAALPDLRRPLEPGHYRGDVRRRPRASAHRWIRKHYMDTPLLAAIFQVVVGGVLVFLTGILIGSS